MLVDRHHAATTDEQGTYTLSNITSGSYHLLVCVCVCVCVCVFMYMCMCMCLHVCTHVKMCVYIFHTGLYLGESPSSMSLLHDNYIYMYIRICL